ncbi:MAG TPA: BTAD domain-containing putative transcriptional regulator [Streptosporangiaceae bacterium]
MWLGILGPLQVRLDGGLVPVAAAKQRTVLAALLVHANRPVSFDDLAAFVWDGSPPSAARVTLRNYIKRLRQAFGPELGGRIRTREPGYLIELAEPEFDLPCFVRHCEAGGAAVRTGQWKLARQELDQAVRLWRSAPLGDVPSELLRAQELPRLDQLRLQALEWQMESGLQLGHHDELIVPLRALAAAYPLRERFGAQLMLALYRSGRQAEALAAYKDVRQVLVRELGVEPGPELQQLQRRILAADRQLWAGQALADAASGHPVIVIPAARQAPGGEAETRMAEPGASRPGAAPAAGSAQPPAARSPSGAEPADCPGVAGGKVAPAGTDPALAAGHPDGAAKSDGSGPPDAGRHRDAVRRRGVAGRAMVRPAERRGPPVPQQLPFDVRQFAGREIELTRLSAFLAEAAGLSVITAVGGCGGVGKTALAVHWAHRLADRFPDGQIYLNLRGYDPALPPMTQADAVGMLLGALGVARSWMPESLDEQTALYRSLASGRRMLILLDNARDSGQVRPLLPGSKGSMVLVTGRSDFVGLVATEGARLLTVGPLSEQESAELMAGRLGREWLTAEPADRQELITLCGRLPLALGVAAARLASSPNGLSALVRELSSAGGLLDGLTGDDQLSSVRAVLSWSCDGMTWPAARMFRLLSLHPGPDISAGAAASLAGVTRREADLALAELRDAQVLQDFTPGRYSFHDLLRAFAAEQAAEHDNEADRAVAVSRVLDYYLGSVSEADRLLYPPGDSIALPRPLRGVRAERFSSAQQAQRWLGAEWRVVSAVIALAADSGLDQQAERLAWLIGRYLQRHGYWQDWDDVQHIALAAAQRAGDPAGIARAHSSAGARCTLAGRYDEAHRHLALALSLEQRLGNQVAQAAIHVSIARALDFQGRYAEALGHVSRALRGYRMVGDRRGRASALSNLGWCHSRIGQHREAVVCCQRAIALQHKLGDLHGEASSWDSLGYAYHQLAQHQPAVRCFRRALDLLAGLGDRYHSSVTLMHLGDSWAGLGDLLAAAGVWREALAIMSELQHPDAEKVRAKLRQVPQSA